LCLCLRNIFWPTRMCSCSSFFSSSRILVRICW
jgi:hypothetical protein